MSEITLHERTGQLFRFALDRTASQPQLANLHRQLQQSHKRLQQPMRVAIVGLIKAGKSTLMNALLGETLVATGSVEATFNVNWLRYGEKASLRVHFKDGRAPETKSLAELAALTLRADENRAYLLSIKYIEVFYPNAILQTFNLIDTPGLSSFYKDDSDNTKEFLRLHGETLTKNTQEQASNADAVLYLFSHSISTEDQSIVQQFQGPGMGQATPINAIGVLTKVDSYASDPKISDPMEAGHRVARRLSGHAKVRRLFYTINPVCGLLAQGAQTLKADEFETLNQLAALPEKRFQRLLRTVKRFGSKEYANEPDIPPAAKRQRVLARLGQYGVSLATDLIRAGENEQERLADELLKHSGVPALRHLILSHFGNRAFLIKLDTGLRQIANACFQERYRQRGTNRQIVEEIAGQFEALKAQELAFDELQVLRHHYEGKLDFNADEVKQLLEVTGEYGTSCGERLGLAERALVREMLPVAEERKRYWQLRANDFIGTDRDTIHAANILARSYERLIYHANEARKHLYL